MNSWMEEIVDLCWQYFKEHGVTGNSLDGWHQVALSLDVELHTGVSRRKRGCLFEDIVVAQAATDADLHRVCAHELTEALLRTETAIPPYQIPGNWQDAHHQVAVNTERHG